MRSHSKSLHFARKPPKKQVSEEEQAIEEFFTCLDKLFQANVAKFTAGMSPAAILTARFSWLVQLALCPGRLLELSLYPMLHFNNYIRNLLEDPLPAHGQDVRFSSPNWQLYPWRLWAENFLAVEDWWHKATVGISGVPSHIERANSFMVRQILDALSPSNFVLTNPDLYVETVRTQGKNIIRGLELGLKDVFELITGTPPEGSENFQPGKQVAVTPGKVIYKNKLIELIQYKPQTETVYKEPILIIPAWIMKYYILDLSPHNSLVKWLVSKGHTVFIISWKNPESEDRNLGMDEYYRLGAMAAIDKVSEIFPDIKIHLMGYCLGGTLAMITAASMARHDDKRLKSLILLAAQGDFTEAGELMLFVTESEIAFLENMMWEQGYLDTKQMAGTFQMLRSYDLIWSKMVQDYMHGTRRGLIDLLAWNADATRMPYKMHSEYLEKLFLNNDFADGRFKVEGYYVVPENIRLPAFVVSTEKDHVAPWQSVYKIHLMLNCNDVTFVLTNGGHNAGIVSPPDHPNRNYRIYERKKYATYIGPEKWLEIAKQKKGSWWIALNEWLDKRSSKEKIKAPKLDESLPDAPGSYVLQK